MIDGDERSAPPMVPGHFRPARWPSHWAQVALGESTDGILLIDAAGALRFVNRTAQQQFGKAFDPAVPVPVQEWAANCAFVMSEKTSTPGLATPWQQATAGAPPAATAVRISGDDRSPLMLTMTAVALPGDGEAGIGTMFVTRHVHDQVHAPPELTERNRLLSAIANSISDSVIVTDLGGRIVEWNHGAEAIFGYPAEEALGRTPALIYPDLREDRLADDMRAILAGRDFNGEWCGRRKDGTRVWVEVKTTTMPDAEGLPVGFIGIAKDITDRKAAEVERSRADDERRAALLFAQSASRAKDEFLAMLGHELRNPLSPIVTALHLMKLKGDKHASKEQRVIERQVDHLVRLVDDLLDVSRITRGTFELKKEKLDVAAVAAKAVEMAGPLLEQRHHHFHMNIQPVRMEADRMRLSQIIANLLTNAARYTEPGGTVSLDVFREGEEVVIVVKDSGVGIAAEMIPHIFDLFIQGQQSADRSRGGLGIGLTLVRQLVHMHQGTVAVHSDGSGKGSEFVVRLPALSESSSEAGEATTPPGLTRPGSSTPRRVLIVDDNADAADLMASMLREVGHIVQVAEDGPRALKLVEHFTPEVALLDIGLPVMDGYELASRLRQLLPPTARLAAVTGYGQEQDRARSQASGFDQHFVKPVDPDRVISYVSQA